MCRRCRPSCRLKPKRPALRWAAKVLVSPASALAQPNLSGDPGIGVQGWVFGCKDIGCRKGGARTSIMPR